MMEEMKQKFLEEDKENEAAAGNIGKKPENEESIKNGSYQLSRKRTHKEANDEFSSTGID